VLSERLVKRGWLARLPGEDRRSHRLALTAAGGRTLRKVGPLATELAEHTLEGLSQVELRGLLKELETIESQLRQKRK
jgi:DNA-binding MarR family transcriptional regulator